MNDFEQPDPLVHAPVRLAILSAIMSVKSADFTFLRDSIHTTDGNLSIHLSKLEEAGYVEIEKEFVDKRPKTTCSITDKGRAAFSDYVKTLENYLYPDSDGDNG